MNMLNGYRVYENVNMTEPYGVEQVRRTWVERLFTLPWKPFKTTYTVTKYRPSTLVIVDDKLMCMFAHPTIVYQMSKQIGLTNPHGVDTRCTV